MTDHDPALAPASAPVSEIGAARAAHIERGSALAARLRQIVSIVLPALLLAAALRSLFYQPFNIPSESMEPNLLVGDYLFVAKWPYGYSRYALPLALPPFDGRILDRPARRGDIVVFKSPADNRTDYIKRVIGLPGDRVRMLHGQIELNGRLVPKLRTQDFVAARGDCAALPPPGMQAAESCAVARYTETLEDGRSYAVLDEIAEDVRDNTGVVTVPAVHVFVLGDNRDNSADSRLTIAEGGVGMVPRENLLGRADRIFLSIDPAAPWTAPLQRLRAIRVARIGTAL